MSASRARLASGAAALAAVAAMAGALVLLGASPTGSAGGWRCYWAALLLAVAAAWPWRGQPSADPPVSRREAVLLAAVVVCGIAFRLYRLGAAPYGVWFDEAQNGLEAMRILAEPGYRPVFVPGISQLPGLIFQWFAVFVDLLGPRILALRLATTVIGVLAIVVAWALGRTLLGRRAGLIAAALLAASRWHVTFNRFAVSNLAVTLFLPLALLFYLRSQDRRSPRDAVFCGLALGLGLQSYYAMLAAPAVLAALFVIDRLRGRPGGRGAAALLGLALATGAFAYAHVLQYARTHGQEFGQRVQATTFVRADSLPAAIGRLTRSTPEGSEARAALLANLKAHALMFHVRGDGNGRHNLPGAPMLDPIAGVLFALGLAWCLARPWERPRAALLLPFAAMMAAGVLSLTFEAPQAARSLGATPFVALMAAVPLAALAVRVQARQGARAAVAGTAAVLALAGLLSFRAFDRQLRDPSAWESYSTPETKIAQVVRAQVGDSDVWVTDTLAGGPTAEFLLGQPLRASLFERGRDLPLPDRGRPALVFLPGSEEETAARVRALYPQATVEPFAVARPEGGSAPPILWVARVPAEAIAALYGWDLQIERVGEPPAVTTVRDSAWEWSQAAPPFIARASATLRIGDEVGLGSFVVDGAGASLRVDGEEVLGPTRRESARLRLARGMHEVEATVRVAARGLRTTLGWRGEDGTVVPLRTADVLAPGASGGGLLGAYHSGADLAGAPVFTRVDPQVAFYFHLLPVPRPFSIRWSGSVYAPATGRYAFGTASVDASSVLVDGRVVLSNPQPSTYLENGVDLDAGWHDLEVRYRAVSDYSQVVLQWLPPDGERARVPAALLRPTGPTGWRRARAAPPPAALPRRLAVTAPATVPTVAPTSPAAVPDDTVAMRIVSARDVALGAPLRIAVGPDGRTFVLSPAVKRVWLVGASGAPVPIPDPPGGWIDPSDLAVRPGGTLLVLDAGGFVAEYSPSRQFVRTLDLRPLGVYNPRGLGATADEILVADTGGGRVLVLDGAGRLRATLGRPGHGAGELIDPADAAIDGAGSVVVVDVGNGRIQRFARDGRVEAWARAGDRPASAAERVEAGADGAVWVGGGGTRELWRLAPSAGPSRHLLPDSVQPDGLALSSTRVLVTAPGPSRIVELRAP